MRFAYLLRVTILLAFIVILMGAYTRLANAGLGCPDWPGCYGHFTVPSQHDSLKQAEAKFDGQTLEPQKAWLEMIHRYLAGTLGILILLILMYLWINKSASKRLAIILTGLVVFQAMLGKWTVTMKLMPIVVMFHLLGGYAVITFLLLVYLMQNQKIKQKTQDYSLRPSYKTGVQRSDGLLSCIRRGDEVKKSLSSFKSHALSALLALIIQIILGGWTSTNYAALSCTSLPICQGNWFDHLQFLSAFSPFQGQYNTYEFGVLSADARTTIHVCHRIWAIVTSLIMLSLCYRLWFSKLSFIKSAVLALCLLLLLQVSLGISNVLFQLPLPVAVAHNGVAVLLLLMLVFINFKLRSA